MSGFERSAPVQGSQGVRRSEMVRFNNAPPPMTPWRQEFLEAQKQIEALKKDRERVERPKSRSRSRERRQGGGSSAKEEERRKGPPPSSGHASSRSVSGGGTAAVPAEKNNLLARVSSSRVEGWYAAVASASKTWDTVERAKRLPQQLSASSKGQREDVVDSRKDKGRSEPDQGKRKKYPHNDIDDREKEKPEQEDEDKKKEDRQAQERLDRQSQEERAAREKRQEEETKRAEEERKRWNQIQSARKQKLRGAFAMDEEDEEDEVREAELLRKAAERKKPSDAHRSSGLELAVSTVSGLGAAAPPLDEDLSSKLRFEPGLDPAEAFMRLQERKRKGRRAEFGGPPRGCSPWRDGKRGVTFEKGGR